MEPWFQRRYGDMPSEGRVFLSFAKRVRPLLLASCLCNGLLGGVLSYPGEGGNIIFATTSAKLITNGLTGSLASGPEFWATLYVAPDGTTDESLYIPTATTPFSTLRPGTINAGVIYVPDLVCGAAAMFQIRAWERAYGSSYEEAVAAGPQDGRLALVGKSGLLRGYTLDHPYPNLVQFGLEGFSLTVVPEPSAVALIGVGMLFLMLFRCLLNRTPLR